MSGVGFLLNGNLLVGVWKESLVVRLGEEALKEPHVKEFDITGGAAVIDPAHAAVRRITRAGDRTRRGCGHSASSGAAVDGPTRR